MNKLFLVKNQEVFQGEKYLKENKNYFEGWYFKNTNNEDAISLIPGINIEENNKKAFIQVITKKASYFIDYNIKDFKYNNEPFYIKIGNNIFSKEEIIIDIEKNNLKIYGNLKYSKAKNINTSFLAPNIMGPFSYLPSMECNHAILCMQNKIDGIININKNNIKFNNDNGYIEKDWGYSFPKSYVWCQGNTFQKSEASFMCSIADIPFKLFNFRGIICVLMIGNKEYKFTTYNNTKIIKYDKFKSLLEITLKKDDYYLNIKTKYNDAHKLSAPVKGKMEKDILESISTSINVKLTKGNKEIFHDISENCGLEIV